MEKGVVPDIKIKQLAFTIAERVDEPELLYTPSAVKKNELMILGNVTELIADTLEKSFDAYLLQFSGAAYYHVPSKYAAQLNNFITSLMREIEDVVDMKTAQSLEDALAESELWDEASREADVLEKALQERTDPRSRNFDVSLIPLDDLSFNDIPPSDAEESCSEASKRFAVNLACQIACKYLKNISEFVLRSSFKDYSHLKKQESCESFCEDVITQYKTPCIHRLYLEMEEKPQLDSQNRFYPRKMLTASKKAILRPRNQKSYLFVIDPNQTSRVLDLSNSYDPSLKDLCLFSAFNYLKVVNIAEAQNGFSKVYNCILVASSEPSRREVNFETSLAFSLYLLRAEKFTSFDKDSFMKLLKEQSSPISHLTERTIMEVSRAGVEKVRTYFRTDSQEILTPDEETTGKEFEIVLCPRNIQKLMNLLVCAKESGFSFTETEF